MCVARHTADGRCVLPDRLGDWPQRQRAHMRDAVQEKAFLLLDDLARDLDDRALALVERADEPVGARELFGQPRLALHRCALSQLGIIAAVDEPAGQRAAVDLEIGRGPGGGRGWWEG